MSAISKGSKKILQEEERYRCLRDLYGKHQNFEIEQFSLVTLNATATSSLVWKFFQCLGLTLLDAKELLLEVGQTLFAAKEPLPHLGWTLLVVEEAWADFVCSKEDLPSPWTNFIIGLGFLPQGLGRLGLEARNFFYG
ncbi:hypothetical protein SUGI_0643480 [Cryptomeria japonica]|nr:hypothetical protein SUGI_0643480 [Cryptomeria japonica]